MFPEMEGSFADELYSESLQLSKKQLDSTSNLISKQSGSDGNLIIIGNLKVQCTLFLDSYKPIITCYVNFRHQQFASFVLFCFCFIFIFFIFYFMDLC